MYRSPHIGQVSHTYCLITAGCHHSILSGFVDTPGSPCPLHSSQEIRNPLASHPLLNHTCQIHTHCLDASLAHMAARGFLERCHKSRDQSAWTHSHDLCIYPGFSPHVPLSVTKFNCKAFWEVGVIDHVRTMLGCRDFLGAFFYTYFKTGFHTMITCFISCMDFFVCFYHLQFCV